MRERPWRAVLYAVMFALAPGCGDGLDREDAAADCDPVTDTGCPGGAHCRVVGDGTLRCLARPAARIEGTGCAADSCAPGSACAVVEGVRGCHPVCRLDAAGACPCSYRIAGAGSPWGVCPAPCDFGVDDCGADATCAPVPAIPYPLCVAVGGAAAGESCGERSCAEGLGCLGRGAETRCERLCDPEADAAGQVACPGACSGVIEGVAEVGYCLD